MYSHEDIKIGQLKLEFCMLWSALKIEEMKIVPSDISCCVTFIKQNVNPNAFV